MCMHEAFTLRDALGLVCIAGGVVLVVSQVPDVQLNITSYVIYHYIARQSRAIVYMSCVLVFVPTWMLWIVPKYKSRHPAVYLILCSSIASVTVVSSRAFASILTNAIATEDFEKLYSSWVPVVALIIIIITAIWSTAYLQKAMAIFPNNKVVPTYYVTFTLASVCAGAIVYREFDCMNQSQPPLFTAGCLTTFVGVFLAGETAAQSIAHRTSAPHLSLPSSFWCHLHVHVMYVAACACAASKGGRQGSGRRSRNARVGSVAAARRHVELLEVKVFQAREPRAYFALVFRRFLPMCHALSHTTPPRSFVLPGRGSSGGDSVRALAVPWYYGNCTDFTKSGRQRYRCCRRRQQRMWRCFWPGELRTRQLHRIG